MQNHFVSSRQIVREFVTQNRRLVAGMAAVLVLNNFLNVLLPLSIGLFYDVALQDHSTKGQMLGWLPLKVTTVQGFFVFFAVLVVLKTVFTFLERYGTGVTGERFARDLRERAFAAQMRHTLQVYRSRPAGKYLLRYSGDLTAAQNFVTKGILAFSGDAFFLLFAFAVLSLMQPVLGAVVVFFFALSALATMLLGRRLRPLSAARRARRSDNLDFVSARLQAFYTVKSFNLENREIRRYRRRSADQYSVAARYLRGSAALAALHPLFYFATLGVVLWLVALWFAPGKGGLGKAEVLSFVLLLLYMRSVMRRVLQANAVWQSGRISLDKLVRMIGQPSEMQADEEEETEAPTEKRLGLRVEHLDFAYENGQTLFRDLSFVIPPESITLVRGTGKTTLLKILQKMTPPDGGKIFLQNTDYERITPRDLRRRVTLVSSEAPLLGGTVMKAIAYKPEAEKREKAMKILDRLGLTFGDGSTVGTLDFKLEPQARNLSAGEAMLLQFARALMTGKPVLLLDDPFPALDASKRRRVVRLLNRLKARHTIVLAAETPPRRLEIDQTIDLQPDDSEPEPEMPDQNHDE